MRTTITLDPDVDQPFAGPCVTVAPPFAIPSTTPYAPACALTKYRAFRQKTLLWDSNPNINWDKALQIASDLEDEEILKRWLRVSDSARCKPPALCCGSRRTPA